MLVLFTFLFANSGKNPDSSLDQATKLNFSEVKAINKVADFSKHLAASSKLIYLFCSAYEVYICRQPRTVVNIIIFLAFGNLLSVRHSAIPGYPFILISRSAVHSHPFKILHKPFSCSWLSVRNI